MQEGYYASPRKAYLQELAAIMGVQRSTYQKHLRKAEHKLMPHMFQRAADAAYVAEKKK